MNSGGRCMKLQQETPCQPSATILWGNSSIKDIVEKIGSVQYWEQGM